jgi:hypothetical protein
MAKTRESKRERREREQRPGLCALPARCKLKSLFLKKKLKNPTLKLTIIFMLFKG